MNIFIVFAMLFSVFLCDYIVSMELDTTKFNTMLIVDCYHESFKHIDDALAFDLPEDHECHKIQCVTLETIKKSNSLIGNQILQKEFTDHRISIYNDSTNHFQALSSDYNGTVELANKIMNKLTYIVDPGDFIPCQLLHYIKNFSMSLVFAISYESCIKKIKDYDQQKLHKKNLAEFIKNSDQNSKIYINEINPLDCFGKDIDYIKNQIRIKIIDPVQDSYFKGNSLIKTSIENVLKVAKSDEKNPLNDLEKLCSIKSKLLSDNTKNFSKIIKKQITFEKENIHAINSSNTKQSNFTRNALVITLFCGIVFAFGIYTYLNRKKSV